jgi:hypothetical protein
VQGTIEDYRAHGASQSSATASRLWSWLPDHAPLRSPQAHRCSAEAPARRWRPWHRPCWMRQRTSATAARFRHLPLRHLLLRRRPRPAELRRACAQDRSDRRHRQR